ncbi:MAG: restriction endonuclease subunit S [Ketobacter sp.]|nr:restriction endonuclease subunit S [Ketobacter sp.]
MNKVAEVSAQYLAELDASAVSEGYKQTEVGVIPEDWEVCELGETVTFQRGFDLPHRLRINGDIPIISSSGESGCHNKAMVKAPGIVTGRYGTIGEIFYIKKDFWPLNTTLYVREFKKLSPEYALHFLRTVDFESHSGKSGVPGVNRNDIHQEKVAVPSVEEQTAIANALSDVDALISELEKLIAKKQAIKTATMQQLLTGRTRLPQFALREDGSKKGYKQSELGEIPEDWLILPMSNLTTLMTNGFVGTAKLHYTDGKDGVTYIQGYNVEENNFNFHGIKKVTPEFHKKNSKSCLKTGDVLMVQTGDVGLVTIVPPELEGANCHALIINRFKSDYEPKFFAYLLNSTQGRQRLRELETGTTMKHINVGDLLYFEVPFPESKQEQAAIAAILSDMDSEIQALQLRLTKTRQIKQGMMQELLTGKTRLPYAAEMEVDDV